MKHKSIFVLIILLSFLYIYMINLDNIPKRIVLFQNEDYKISHLIGIDIEGNNAKRLFNNVTKIESDKIGEGNLFVKTFGGLFVKDVEVSVLPATRVVLGGDTVGIRLYSKGVLVVGESPVQGFDGNYYEPYKTTNIKNGDKILKVNNQVTETISDLVSAISDVDENEIIQIEYERDGKVLLEDISPIKSFEDGSNKLGLWVRDGAMGVGTITFCEVESGKFCALGHGISDYDLKELIDVDKGYLNLASVVSVNKGESGAPGEIKGILNNNYLVGDIEVNNEHGIYGDYHEECGILRDHREVLVASKNEIKLGEASILCTVDETNIPKEYKVNIIRVSGKENSGTKGMVIEVTDENLLEKTGGIIQGMSGSPIIQNNRLIGAVTHVYVNDPTKGYAIFADTMIEEINKLKNESI